MYQLSGIRLLAKEKTEHSGWDPRFGVWVPELQKISEEKPSPVQPVLPELQAAQAVDLGQSRIFWRGPGSLGDSLGNFSFESLFALQRMGMGNRLRFDLLSDWKIPPDLAGDSRLEQVRAIESKEFSEADWEVIVPGNAAAKNRRSARFFFHEFGNFYAPPVTDQDVLWGPSRFIAKSLASNFPRNRVFFAPHGVDRQVFHPEVAPHPGLNAGKRFRFLYVGTTISRKGVDLLLRAFLAEKDSLGEASLVLKVFPTTAGFVWPEIYAQGDRIEVWDKAMSARELASLMRSCDVLVSPSRAEAFCMPVLEAMAVGLPAILPKGSTMQEFCPESASILVDAEEVRIPVQPKEIRFLEPDLNSLRQALRTAYEKKDELPSMGKSAAKAAAHYSWDHVTRMILSKLLQSK